MHRGALVLCALLISSTLGAQLPAGIPPEQAAAYRIDLARHFYASPEAERADLRRLDSLLARIEALRGKVDQTAAALEQAMQLTDAIRVEQLRHSAYLSVRSWTDIRDATSALRLQELNAQVVARSGFVSDDVHSMSAATVARFLRERRSLARYDFAIAVMRRGPSPRLTERELTLLLRLSPLVEHWQGDMYNRLFGRRVDTEQDQDAYAYLLLSRARAGNVIASLRSSQSALALAYDARFLSVSQVNATTTALAAQRELNARYERARIANLRKRLGRENVLYYSDYLAPPAGDAVPRFTIDSARSTIERALSPLGAAYTREVHALLDPANGRLDLVPGPFRAIGGFTPATVSGAGVSVFYASSFTGTFADLITLVHEGGHAVQFEFMRSAGVLPVYSNGPPWLAESYAYLNELLLADHLYRSESVPARKTFYLEQLIDRELQAMPHARDVAFEEALYAGVADGTLSGAASLNTLFDSIGARYSVWHGLDPAVQRQWTRIPHYFRAPFYRVNYMYGRLLAIRYFDMYRRDPTAFVPRFTALLRAGNSAAPADLLARHLGITFDGPALASGAAALIETHLAELEARYAASGP